MELEAKERLIVALDVSTAKEARDVVDDLEGVVSFFKVGWQLFIGGEWRQLLDDLHDKKVFVDLKVPGDIGNTIRNVVEACVTLRVRFLTLSDSVALQTIEAAKAGRGQSRDPELLMVPYLSSLDETDFEKMYNRPGSELDRHIRDRASSALSAGCDGLIASGKAIALLRKHFQKTTIVSPGIRPEGFPSDDHKRLTTPSEAIRLGADYLVVGRPIRLQNTRQDRRSVAERIISEIGTAIQARSAKPAERRGLSEGHGAERAHCKDSD